ncbi:DoxX-like family protein [Virgibacillus ndiopensis]|uniref:DoxX-like family protein n=1 Tax=Virgibacillus ndiopensis TaxID=2004408 RepID=UPI000C0806C6|nr:DoxX-like family protein [Virgibacillus ndiopensis]
MKSKPIYVEIPINAEMEKLWNATQQPDQHEQWDLRFSSITYLPKEENKPQEFTYKTKVGFGIAIEGWGRSVGSHHAEDGSKTSSLHFGTDQAISIIREGRGYWKYISNGDSSIKFLTQYDYKTSFGRVGKWFDQILFRPLIGWGTALSFDVLKRWLEKGETPSSQYIRFFSNWLITFFFFFIWTYHGLVPKIINMHPEEIAMLDVFSITSIQAYWLVMIMGIVEGLFGLVWLLYSNKRRLYGIQIVLFPILMLGAIIAQPSYLIRPFNPLTFNLALFVLSIAGFMISKDIPTAKSCKRKR